MLCAQQKSRAAAIFGDKSSFCDTEAAAYWYKGDRGIAFAQDGGFGCIHCLLKADAPLGCECGLQVVDAP
jgi:hypothetical protein